MGEGNMQGGLGLDEILLVMSKPAARRQETSSGETRLPNAPCAGAVNR
jgi:hypothetical protein